MSYVSLSKKHGLIAWYDRMRIMDNYKEINVASQENDQDSVLNFYRRMLALRKQYSEALIFGTFELHDRKNEKTFVYTKKGAKAIRLVIALNFSGESQDVTIPGEGKKKLILSSALKPSEGEKLKPYEGRIYQIEA